MARDHLPRLRCAVEGPAFNIVLIEPEIPQNTGNIARLAGATQSPLHLVGKLGFRIDEHAVRRAGVDYWHLVDVRQHEDVDALVKNIPGSRLLLFSATAKRSYLDARYRRGDALVFGRESVGLDDSLLQAHSENVFGIPTIGAVRSLNLANAASIVIYEALRQVGALDHAQLEEPRGAI